MEATVTQGRTIDEWKALAQKFRPWVILCNGFSLGQRFYDEYQPSSVQFFMQHSTLKSRSNASLNIPSPTERDLQQHNDRAAYLKPDPNCFEGDYLHAPYYTHISSGVSGTVRFQYWFFYPYNGAVPFITFNLGDHFVGAHEGDWEHVDVYVNLSSGVITQIFFAAHGSAEGKTLFKSTTGEPDAAHFQIKEGRPVVYSAWHSHASYSFKGTHLRWITAFFSNDVTTSGPTWDGAAEVVAIDPDLLPRDVVFNGPAWLDWQGEWGSDSSPRGPKLQDPWLPPAGSGNWSDSWVALPPMETGRWPVQHTNVSLDVEGNLTVLMSGASGGGFRLAHQSQVWEPTAGWTAPIAFEFNASGTVAKLETIIDAQQMLRVFMLVGEYKTLCSVRQKREQNRTVWTQGLYEFTDTPALTDFALTWDRTGAIQILGVGPDGLYDISQLPGEDEDSWAPPIKIWSGTALTVLAVTRGDGVPVAAIWTPKGISLGLFEGSGWTFPVTLSSGLMPLALRLHMDNRLTLFALNGSGVAQQRSQYSISDLGSWSNWIPINGEGFVELLGGREANGLLALAARHRDGTVWTCRVSNPEEGAWTAWQRIAGSNPAFERIAWGKNADGRLEVVATSKGYLYHAWQNTPFRG
jgi:hypothetical protein